MTSGASVQQLPVSIFGQVTDCALGNANLEVGVHAAKGESLLCALACLFECAVLKSAVVAVIVCDFYAVVGCELLEGALGFYCFVGR